MIDSKETYICSQSEHFYKCATVRTKHLVTVSSLECKSRSKRRPRNLLAILWGTYKTHIYKGQHANKRPREKYSMISPKKAQRGVGGKKKGNYKINLGKAIVVHDKKTLRKSRDKKACCKCTEGVVVDNRSQRMNNLTRDQGGSGRRRRGLPRSLEKPEYERGKKRKVKQDLNNIRKRGQGD